MKLGPPFQKTISLLLAKKYSRTFRHSNTFIFALRTKQHVCLFPQKYRHSRRPTDFCREFKQKSSQNLQSAQEPLSYCSKLWIFRKQLGRLKSSQQEKIEAIVDMTFQQKQWKKMRFLTFMWLLSDPFTFVLSVERIACSQCTSHKTTAREYYKTNWKTLFLRQKK